MTLSNFPSRMPPASRRGVNSVVRWVTVYSLILIAIAPAASGQTSRDVVVARLLIDIEGIEADFPDKASGLLPLYLDLREAYRLSDEVVEALKNPSSSPVKMALDSVYAVVAIGLSEGLGFRIAPLDTLRGSVKYLFGYPVGNAEKVAKTARFAGAMEIEIDVSVPDANQSSWAIFSTGKVRAKGRPEMEMRVRYVDSTGGGWKEKVRVRSASRVSVDEYWVLGIRKRSTTSADESLLPDLTRAAVREMVSRLQKRGVT